MGGRGAIAAIQGREEGEMTYREAKCAVIEKVALQRCWRALNPDVPATRVEVPDTRYHPERRFGDQHEKVWARGPRARKSAVIRAILRSGPDEKVTAYNMSLPF